MRRCAAIPLILLFSIRLFGQASDISINAAGISVLETDPGEALSFAVIVQNTSDREQLISSDLKIPDGWKVLFYTNRLAVDPLSDKLSLISVYVPQSARAGSYTIQHLSWSAERPWDKIPVTIEIIVRERILVKVDTIEVTAYIIAGQEITASFSIENQSNTDVYVEFSASSSEGYPVQIHGDGAVDLLIQSGQRREVTLSVKTDPNRGSLLRHRVFAKAYLTDASKVRSTAIAPVSAQAETEIFPKTQVSGDRFRRLPLHIELLQFNSFSPAWEGTGGVTLSAKGALDPAQAHVLDLLLVKSIDLPPEQFFQREDVYRLGYENEFLKLSLGDLNYSLTPLLERSAYARGGMFDVSLGPIGFGSYYRLIPYSDPLDQLLAGYLSYGTGDGQHPGTDRYRTMVSVMSTLEDTVVLSILQFLKPVSVLAMEFEAALEQSLIGDRSCALRFEGEGEYDWISYSAEFLNAQSGFSGSYQDVLLYGADIGLEFLDERVGISTGIHREVRNLDLDLQKTSAPLKWTYFLNSDVTLPSGDTTFAAGWNLTNRKDLLPNPSFHTVTNSMKLSAEHLINTVQLYGSASLGLEQYRLEDELQVTHEYLISSRYQPSSAQSYYLDLSYKGTVPPGLITSHDLGWSTGITLNNRILELDFSSDNRFEFDGGGLDHSTLGASLDLDFELGENSSLLLSSYYNYSDGAAANHSGGFLLKYSTSVGVPLGFKENIGTLKGTVVDAVTGEPLKDIILRSGAEAAVTDKRGRFVFPALEPGTRLLDVDVSRADTFLQPFVNTPIEVLIENNKTTTLVVEMGRRSVIRGTVRQYALLPEDSTFDTGPDAAALLDPGAADGADASPAYVAGQGIQNVLLELTNNSETYRRLTDSNGRFSFDDLIPGRWTLTIYDFNIPQYHLIETKEFMFDLAMGERATVEIRVLPQKRSMKMIDQGSLSL